MPGKGVPFTNSGRSRARRPPTAEGADLLVDLRERLDRLEAKLRIDVDEIKNAVLSRLEGIDVERLGPRLNGLEQAASHPEEQSPLAE
jgi:hypothetical protein